MALTDALGRDVPLGVATRVVCLLPSETENVVALAGSARVVGRTDFCPPVEGAVSVGGTKKCSVEAVLALAPDLVLANKEENGQRDVERLIDAGLRVYVGFPKTVADAVDHLDALVQLLGAGQSRAAAVRAEVAAWATPIVRRRVFVPIWREPYMTFDARTYAHDLLRCAGLDNVYANRRRRFPLAADLGAADPVVREGADTRYPRTSLAEVAQRAPELVLFPDEPYVFEPEHAEEVRAAGIDVEMRFVSGQDLFWPGVRTGEALRRLRPDAGI